jgi:hypothetical protein
MGPSDRFKGQRSEARTSESEVAAPAARSMLGSDEGRAMNNFEHDWHYTLSGRPQLADEF